MDYIQENTEFAQIVNQIKLEQDEKAAVSVHNSNYELDVSDLQKTPSGNDRTLKKESLSVSSQNDEFEKISTSRDIEDDQIFFQDPCLSAPKGKDSEEQGLRECLKECKIY